MRAFLGRGFPEPKSRDLAVLEFDINAFEWHVCRRGGLFAQATNRTFFSFANFSVRSGRVDRPTYPSTAVRANLAGRATERLTFARDDGITPRAARG
jgi:hypothetical protein